MSLSYQDLLEPIIKHKHKPEETGRFSALSFGFMLGEMVLFNYRLPIFIDRLTVFEGTLLT